MNKHKISVILIYKDKTNLERSLNTIINQTFSNIEIVCVNNASKDNAEEIVTKAAEKDERIKMLTLPYENDIVFAQKAGLGIADGDFVYFVTPDDDLKSNFIMDAYIQNSIKEDISIKNNHLYRRNFLENDEEITDLISKKIKQELDKYTEDIAKQKEELKTEFDKFYQVNAENIKNSSYEIMCRFNQLEKNFYDKDYQYNELIKKALTDIKTQNEDSFKKVYEDISKVYEYINSESNKKGCDINHVYEEITKNYNYTEELIENKKKELTEISDSRNEYLTQKVSELEKEIIVRYTNLKRLMDMQLDDIVLKVNSLTGQSAPNDINKTINENIDNMYSQINKMSSTFYNELSKIYQEVNEKVLNVKEEYKYNIDKKISELRTEINSRTGKE